MTLGNRMDATAEHLDEVKLARARKTNITYFFSYVQVRINSGLELKIMII